MAFSLEYSNSFYESNPTPATENSIARVAIAENGKIVYANNSFCIIANISYKDISQTDALSLFQFHKDKTISRAAFKDIKSGIHSLFIAGNEYASSFHFDWLKTPDGHKFLIGCENDDRSLILDDHLPQSEMQVFEAQIQRISTKTTDKDYSYILDNNDDVRRFLNLSHDVMVIVNANGQIKRVNRTFYELLGYGDEDIATMDFIDLFAPEDREQVVQNLDVLNIQRASKQNKISNFTARMPTKYGDSCWLEWRQRMLGDTLYCVARDITDIKCHEEALVAREKQLEQAEQIGRMGHWSWHVGERNVEWSEEIYRIFGVERETFFPGIDKLTEVVYRRDVGRVLQSLQHALIQKNDYDVEFRIKRPNNEMRYIRCEGRCQKNINGEVVGLYGIMQDMTERVLYEKELHKAKDRAERAYAAKTQFLANMSHELRTPLNAIIGFSEMIQQQLLGPIGTKKYLEYIDGIRGSGEHLLDLISDILDMSKIEAGKYELDLEEVNMNKITNVAMSMMASRADEAQIALSMKKIKNKNLKIIADRRAILQILLNLISNAVKFSKPQSIVTIECIEQKKFITMNVRDTGIGIPANKLQSITNPFEQVSSSYARKHEGSGLGLAITKELIELHGGTLNIQSQIGEGTHVSVSLPYDASKFN